VCCDVPLTPLVGDVQWAGRDRDAGEGGGGMGGGGGVGGGGGGGCLCRIQGTPLL